MNTRVPRIGTHGWSALFALVMGLGLISCQIQPTRSVSTCVPPQGHNLEAGFQKAQQDLSNGCATQFDAYVTSLLHIAEGDPQAENKRRFSEFFVWSSEQGLLSKRQAKQRYNRYFNIKFVSLMGDFNNCSHACPRKQNLLADMEQELRDKEWGLLKVSLDKESYYRADRLLKETELVLEATCSACAGVP